MSASLIVPGLQGSGAGHWQRWWLGLDRQARWVDQPDWETPDLDAWHAVLVRAIEGQPRPVWLVAHSFGSLAAVAAIRSRPERIAGALLVAPADPDRFGLGAALSQGPLPVPTLMVVSSNDPWMRMLKAAWWAVQWGSTLRHIGPAGHINGDSGFGPWPEGWSLFAEFRRAHASGLQGDIPWAQASAPSPLGSSA